MAWRRVLLLSRKRKKGVDLNFCVRGLRGETLQKRKKGDPKRKRRKRASGAPVAYRGSKRKSRESERFLRKEEGRGACTNSSRSERRGEVRFFRRKEKKQPVRRKEGKRKGKSSVSFPVEGERREGKNSSFSSEGLRRTAPAGKREKKDGSSSAFSYQ